MNQIVYILVQRKLKGQINYCRTYSSAELCSDHFLVIANVNVKHCVSRSHRKVVKMYDVDKLEEKIPVMEDFMKNNSHHLSKKSARTQQQAMAPKMVTET